jgi:signal transduction histidine kinase
MILIGVGVLALVLFSSSYFIGSIVNPVGQVSETARKIAQGDFSARLPKKTDDEIGELCEIINYMASELATAEQLKNDFISSVSHELRTPLTAIQGWAETVLTTGGEDRELLEKGMGVVISETGRLSQMVEELLDFSRMQSGRLRLVMARIDALAELYEACLMYAQRARREGIGLVYEDDEAAVVYGDRGKLRQVFVNVLDNAIKYSNPGGEVHIETTVTPQTLTVRVSDNGIGIRAEDLPKIKQKFFKADSTRRGSGIGLAVADEIITRHGGTFTIDSIYGEGTTVTLTLPIYNKTDETFSLTD